MSSRNSGVRVMYCCTTSRLRTREYWWSRGCCRRAWCSVTRIPMRDFSPSAVTARCTKPRTSLRRSATELVGFGICKRRFLMRYAFFGITNAAFIFALAAQPALAQAPQSASSGKTWVQPKTPWGDPDMQGTWTGDDCIGTPENRPASFGNRGYYTEQELADKEKQIQQRHERDSVETVAKDARVGTGPPNHWGESARRPCKQTSLVVDPPDGQTPALVPAAVNRPHGEAATNNNPKADSWEDFSYYIRCISRGVIGSIYPGVYG